MFTRTDDKITSSQATVFVTNTVLGARILTFPRTITQETKSPDSWIAVLLGGLIVMVAIALMVKLCQQFQGQTIFQFAGRIVGKFPGGLLCLLLILYFVANAGYEIRSLAEVILFFLLEGTPMWAVVLPFIWVGTYLVLGGINAISRFFQIIFPITILVLIVSYAISFRLFNLDHLLPVLESGTLPVFRGLRSAIFIYTGCEVVMTLVAFMDHPRQAMRAMLGGIAISLGLYFLTVIFVIGGLTIDSTTNSTWPTIELIRSFEITGFIIERLELPLLVIWMMQMFCNFSSFLFQASIGLSQLFNLSLRHVIFGLAPVIFLSVMLPKSFQDLFSFGDAIGIMEVALFVLLPGFLSLVWLLRRKGWSRNV